MTPRDPQIETRCGSDREFLFSRNQSPAGAPAAVRAVEPALAAAAVQAPPATVDEEAETAFLARAMPQLTSAGGFGTLAVRIDPLEVAEDGQPEGQLDAVRRALAAVVDGLCRDEDGLWAEIGVDVIGCFLPGRNAPQCREAARRIQQTFSGRRSESVSIGIAMFPCINYHRRQMLANARKALDHAAFFGPGSRVVFDAVSLNISGDRFYQAGDFAGAVEEFKRALLLNPTEVNVHNSLGVCYGLLGRLDEALAAFEAAVFLDSQEPLARYNSGLVHMLQDRNDAALACFRAAGRIAPELFEVAFQTGKLYLLTGEPAKAVGFLEKAAGFEPAAGPVQAFLGQCYEALERPREAVAAYKRAVKQNPADAASLSAIGHLFDLQGENPEIATLFCRQSVALEPASGLYRHRLGRLLLKQDQLEAALEAFEAALARGYDAREEIENLQRRLTARAS
jgi:tetratricopeptide (TPR) repeat protein